MDEQIGEGGGGSHAPSVLKSSNWKKHTKVDELWYLDVHLFLKRGGHVPF